jgi:hypothetical protein
LNLAALLSDERIANAALVAGIHETATSYVQLFGMPSIASFFIRLVSLFFSSF